MIKLVGTGHIFERSVREVCSAIDSADPGIVAIELDSKRFEALRQSGWDLSVRSDSRSFASALRGGSFPVLFEFFLSKIQEDLGKNLGIEPGSDMVAAIKKAQSEGRKIALIDRDISITLNHMLAIPFKEKLGLFSRGDEDLELVSGLLGSGVESILEEENIEKMMSHLRGKLPALYCALVDERDMYMALALRNLQAANPEKDIVAVVGAGHVKGLMHYITSPQDIGDKGLMDRRKVSRLQILVLIPPLVLIYIWMKIKFRFRK